jgi:hypothetical protein
MKGKVCSFRPISSSSYLHRGDRAVSPVVPGGSGSVFTEEERSEFELHGLLPPSVATLDEQVDRRLQALRQLPNDFAGKELELTSALSE